MRVRAARRMLATFAALSIPVSVASAADLTLAEYQDKARGAWAGQMIGVAYGSVYEFKAQGRILEEPIREWKPEFIRNAIGQDDLYVEMTFLKALEEHGVGISDEQAGEAFAQSRYSLWHANRAGRDNCRAGIMPPLSGHPDHNPHADDIDFQIEADLFGIITPGMARAMSRLCDRFGHIMNYGDGVYGGMFVAGMYSAAFFEDDVEQVVLDGLRCIPPRSKYGRLIRDVIACHERDPADWRACWRLLEEKWAPYDLCPAGRNTPFNIDAKLNGGYIAIGLLYGDGDFDKTLEITTRCGQDADCNPSNAGGVLGAVVGFNAIPERFKAGLGEIADEKFAYTDYSFSTLTDACTRLARRIVEANGGSIERGADGEVWHMKRQPPRPPKGLQQWIVLDNELRLRATPGLEGERGVRLQWEAVPTATRYRLVRSGAASERGETIFETEKATSYEDSAVAPGRVATYRMMVRLSDGQWHSSVPVRSFIFTPNPTNLPGATNLARSPWATPDAAVLNPTGSGLRDIGVISDGIVADQNYDSFDGKNPAQEDWYAIRFARGVRANAVEYVEGKNFHDGGWWLSLTVQYLDPETFEWRECEHVHISPDYDFEDRQDGRAPYSRWTLTFAPVACAGIRIFGRPGGEAAFTSIAELEVFYW